LRVHPFSTRSHAKFIICDEGNPNRLAAVLGSCNWFYSNFTSFDASVRLRDPEIVSDLLFQVAELSCGVERHWTDITDEFARLAVNARQQPSPGGARAIGTLVTGPEHGRFVRQARDEAKSRIFVMSHRLGAASKAFILPPAQGAAAIRDLDVKIYYGVVNPEMRNEVSRLISSAEAAGVRLQHVHEPTIHAKILAWDDDNLLITSRNWLSADSAESNPFGEIGLYVQARSSARLVLDQFDLLRNYT
jgi:cardiolipin synthase